MIRVDRSKEDEPSTLHKKNSKGLSELERVRAHKADRANDGKSFDFSAYKTATVKTALDALFHGKCAYCESFYSKTQPVDVEHYRPKGEVEQTDHPGYWWLGMDWDNLLPSCIDCNRRRTQDTPKPTDGTMIALLESGKFTSSRKILTGKQAIFPLAGDFRAVGEDDDLDQEERLLLDPCRDDPDDHLVFHIDRQNLVGLVFPKPISSTAGPVLPRATDVLSEIIDDANIAGVSAMGAVSIQVYGLNRLRLVQERTRHLRDLEFLLELLLGLEEMKQEIRAQIDAKTAKQAAASGAQADEYSTDVAFLTDIDARLDQHVASVRQHMVAMTEPTAPYSAQAQAWLDEYIANG